MSDFQGFTETSLEPSPSTSLWGLRYTLQSPTGEYLDLCTLGLTRQPERARLITAKQAERLKTLHPELASLALRKGPWKP